MKRINQQENVKYM